MYASQLLRILQTIPSNVKHETCVSDSAEQDMTMKENQNETLHGSISFGREVDALAFESKEVYQINGLRKDTHPSPFEPKGRDECWNPKFLDDLSTDNQKVTRDSAGDEFQNQLLYHLSSLGEDADLLSSEPNAEEKVQSSPQHHECSVAGEEVVHRNENESRDSRSPYIAASDLFEKDNNLFNDKILLECEPPELIVCYKEISYHVVKDICVDEGMPVNSKILTDCSKDDQSDHFFPQPLNDDRHCTATGAVDKEFTSSKNTKSTIANEHGSEEESHDILLSQRRPKSPENSFAKDTAKECDQEDSVQKSETNFCATSKTVNHASEESFMDRTLPIQEYGTRSFLRSFLNSLNGEENTVKKLPDQISSGKVVSEDCAPSSAEAGPKEDVQASTLCYNSKVETGSITFNFNSLAPVVGGDTNGRTENVKEQSVDSSDMLDHKDADADNLSDARQVHHESSKDIRSENAHVQRKDENSVVLPSSSQVVDSLVLKHEHRDPDNDSVVSLRKYDVGESSFSAAGLINYSGPMSYSGSLSLRSDGSTTSARSFAFPILQPEWNSSPVRMTKADGRHFRKHKGWRSGLLCCRF